MDEPEPHPAYDFFASGPLPGYAGNPNNNNGWIETNVPLLGELGVVADEPIVGPLVGEIAELMVEMEEQVIALMIDMEEDISMLFGDVNFSNDDSEGFEDEEEVWEVDKEWLMAPVTPPTMSVVPLPSTYEVGGPSTAIAEGHSFPLPASGLPVPPKVIEDLSTRMGNLEYGHQQLVKKRDRYKLWHPRWFRPWVDWSRLVPRWSRTMVSEMSSRESTLMQCILGMDRRLADLERRPPGPQ
ncbi:hypothetical protein Tco_0102508 [Tanacetum coccineum]